MSISAENRPRMQHTPAAEAWTALVLTLLRLNSEIIADGKLP